MSQALCLLLLNCTIILPTLVHHKNKRIPAQTEINSIELLNKLCRDDRIRITKKDNQIIEGKFVDIFQFDHLKYSELYKKFQNANPNLSIPFINDRITVVLKPDITIEGTFHGFDFYQILIKRSDFNKEMMIDILNIKELTSPDNSYTLSKLVELINSDTLKVPIYSNIGLTDSNKKYIVSFNDIKLLEKINKKYSLPGSFFLGLLGDSFLALCAVAYIGASIGGSLR
jgi:small nuclear ribonucleoprotein (snRNP)-like protein